ncbi:MAG: membrane protein insertase YidC [Saprospiraceae bacterium]|nr:membrane protein insertase YidC [Saprospiraceae bacterium]
MDKNTIIGIVLIFLLFYVWAKMNAPTEAQLTEMQRVKDSIAMAEQMPLDRPGSMESDSVAAPVEKSTIQEDSIQDLILQRDYGVFANAAKGTSDKEVLENDLIKITFDSKGGSIVSAELKTYQRLLEDEEKKDVFKDLFLMDDEKNKFEYLLPVAGAPNGIVKTSDLYFKPAIEGNTLIMTAHLGGGKSIKQTYTLNESNYDIAYNLTLTGLDDVLANAQDTIRLNWVNYLEKIEKNTQYERIYSTVHYKEVGEDPSYCSMSGDDEEDLNEVPVKWISHSNQFFNSTLIGTTPFASARVTASAIDEEAEDLKLLTSQMTLALGSGSTQSYDMTWYIGPNEFERLRAHDLDMEDIVPFGWSIFGTINRWVIRPIFSFLSNFIGNKGIVILFLTLIVKSLVYPLTYKMLYSQSKMGALKPQMAKLREKHKDDQQKVQMETMKIYREYGVNPAGGCFPMILQMPIWFALYRFFPASIEFRQASFLWANDLSSYDVFFRLPFEIPFLGDHLSLFTFLWAISMVIYTYYNSKIMDMNSINPMMKYMQYMMPVMFIFFFNSYASGLTCYLLFSNLMNITQTLVTKNYLINNDKILAELDANKKKPKKKGGFQQRLEKALQEQQRIAGDRSKKK